MKTILLFDVDGTLLLTGGAGRRAMQAAFARHCGDGSAVDRVDMRGMTDPGIISNALRAAGLACDETLQKLLIDSYLEALATELARVRDYQVMPGVGDLMIRLGRRAEVAVGLGTGNVERGARLKLERCGLAGYFSFGGYGSDSGDRASLLAIGARRGAELHGVSLGDCRVVVIGDTPRDVAAGLAIGAEVLAVGTGGHELRELAGCGATRVVPNLADPCVLPFLLGTGHPLDLDLRSPQQPLRSY